MRKWCDETIVMTAVTLAAAALATPASASETLWTSYLRVGPGPQYAVQQQLSMHTELGVIGCQAGWCQVQSGRVIGYVRREALGDPSTQMGGKPGTDCFDDVLSGHPGGDHVRICRR